MTTAWQTYQTQLAALLENRPVPAPNWGRRRRALASCGPMPSVSGARDEPVAPYVRLPGIWQPEYGPLIGGRH